MFFHLAHEITGDRVVGDPKQPSIMRADSDDLDTSFAQIVARLHSATEVPSTYAWKPGDVPSFFDNAVQAPYLSARAVVRKGAAAYTLLEVAGAAHVIATIAEQQFRNDARSDVADQLGALAAYAKRGALASAWGDPSIRAKVAVLSEGFREYLDSLSVLDMAKDIVDAVSAASSITAEDAEASRRLSGAVQESDDEDGPEFDHKKADREDREAEREEELKHASDWMRKRIKNQREAERRADFWDRRKKCYGSPAGFFVNPSEEDKPAYMTAGPN